MLQSDEITKLVINEKKSNENKQKTAQKMNIKKFNGI